MVDHYVVSEAEWASGGLSPAKLECLARSFARDGAVVLENCLPHAVLDALSRRMDSDAAHQLAESKWKERGPNGAGGHLQQGPPRHAPYVHREIVANMFLEQAATAALGGASVALPLSRSFLHTKNDKSSRRRWRLLPQLLQRQHQPTWLRHPVAAL